MSWWYRRSVGGEIATPERIPLTSLATVQGAEVAHGVGPVLAPPHAGQLQPLADHRLAGALHRAAADAPALGQVLGVLHPVRVAFQVADQFLGRLAQARPARPLPLAQDGRQDRATFVLEQLPPLPC